MTEYGTAFRLRVQVFQIYNLLIYEQEERRVRKSAPKKYEQLCRAPLGLGTSAIKHDGVPLAIGRGSMAMITPMNVYVLRL